MTIDWPRLIMRLSTDSGGVERKTFDRLCQLHALTAVEVFALTFNLSFASADFHSVERFALLFI